MSPLGEMKRTAIAKDRIYYDPEWFPDGRSLLVSAATAETGFHRKQIGMVSFPSGEFHLLTTDTNDYYHPNLSADGQSIAANQSQSRIQLEIASAGALENFTPLKLSSNLPFSDWDWTPDDQLLLTQGTDIRLVNPAGGNRAVFSDANFPIEQAVSCGEGRYVVFRSIGRSGGAQANLWRIDSNGTNLKQVTSGVNERTPACSHDGKWLYYIDAAENHFLKRIPIDGGSPETMIKSPPNPMCSVPTEKPSPHSKCAKRITPAFSFCIPSRTEENRYSNSIRADSPASPSRLPEKRSCMRCGKKVWTICGFSHWMDRRGVS